MCNELTRHLANFPCAVLTGVDVSGYPFSLLCQPEPDHVTKALRVEVPEHACIQTGPAGLLCHSHDDQLWNLVSFIVRGKLEKDSEGWIFQPRQFIPGAGFGGMIGLYRFVRDGRRMTKKYLRDRNLPRPRLSWDEIAEIWAEVEKVQT